MQDLEQAIRERAYHLWVEGGRHEGDADAHWITAQREILSVSLATFARVRATEHPRATRAKKSKASGNKRAA
jgi:hypothetical protein